MLRQRKIIFIVTAIVLSVIGFISCIDTSKEAPADPRGNQYAGADACISCHQNVYDSYLHTAHYNTSRPPTDSVILGNFSAPGNDFFYNDSMKVTMSKKDNRYFETAYINGRETESHSIDIIIGSGGKAQTFLYRKDDEIYQLPVSYFAPASGWANSPGFPADHISFARSISSSCFGCHASAANVKLAKTGSLSVSEKYVTGQMLLRIDCERCHGPAREHVDYQKNHPKDREAKYIALISKLTRRQKMDMCGVCHSGIQKTIQPVFNFKPGDVLDNYYYPDVAPLATTNMDVHGTQTQLLMASKCYRKSNTLTCMSCHDSHKNERDQMEVFSQRCMTCHSEANHNFCTLQNVAKEKMQTNCIDCHMPAKPSKVITLLTRMKENPVPDYIRTHLITVYPDETQKVLRYMQH
jgi:hypothetical protein